MSLTDEEIEALRELTYDSRIAQGLPPVIEDAGTLAATEVVIQKAA